jgi:hypothetical protein
MLKEKNLEIRIGVINNLKAQVADGFFIEKTNELNAQYTYFANNGGEYVLEQNAGIGMALETLGEDYALFQGEAEVLKNRINLGLSTDEQGDIDHI